MSAFTAEEQKRSAARLEADLDLLDEWLRVAPAPLVAAARTIAWELAEACEEDRIGSARRDVRYTAGLRFGIEANVRQVPGFTGSENFEAVRRGLVHRYLHH